MRVRLLGTSSAEGWPGLFCGCSACADARRLGGKNIRTRASAMVDARLKIDLPPDTLAQVIAHNLDLSLIDAILITHAHDDHCCTSEIQYRGIHFVPQPISDPLPIYGPAPVIEKLEAELGIHSSPIEPRELQPWRTVCISDYRVTPIVANHDPSQLCFNYLIESADGDVLLYAVDTGWYSDQTWEFLESRRIDTVVVECAKGMNTGGYSGHLSIPDVVRMKDRLTAAGAITPDTPVVTTHFCHLSGLLHRKLEDLFSPHGIKPAYDGLELDVRSSFVHQPVSSV